MNDKKPPYSITSLFSLPALGNGTAKANNRNSGIPESEAQKLQFRDGDNVYYNGKPISYSSKTFGKNGEITSFTVSKLPTSKLPASTYGVAPNITFPKIGNIELVAVFDKQVKKLSKMQLAIVLEGITEADYNEIAEKIDQVKEYMINCASYTGIVD